MGLRLPPPDIVQVVGDDMPEANLGPESQQLLVEAVLLSQAMILQLEEETVRPEDVAVLAGQLASQLPVVDLERLGDLAAKAGGEADQTLRVLRQVFTVDPGLVVVAVEVRIGDEAAQVLVSLPVLGEKDEVEGLAVGLAFLVVHAPAGDVRLDADDGFDAPCRNRLHERHRPVKSPVVGDGHGVETELRALFGKLVDAAEPIEQAELGVEMQVDEVVRSNGHGG